MKYLVKNHYEIEIFIHLHMKTNIISLKKIKICVNFEKFSWTQTKIEIETQKTSRKNYKNIH